MIWLYIVFAVAIIVLLEWLWMPAAQKALRFQGTIDHIMAQPGEKVIWTSTVENHSRIPIPFARLTISCPEGTCVDAPENWLKTHYRKGVYHWYVEERMALKPRQRVTRNVVFSLPKRGGYRIGEYQLSVGDLVGIREGITTGKGKSLVIIPDRSQNCPALQALGGFLGDVSVRRFILEDPVLTVGFRDYTGREPLKAVSWTRTAVAGKLQVKQFDYTAEHIVTILLNVDGAEGECLEECFRLTRSVCEELEKRKMSYAFRTNGNLPYPAGKLFSLPDGLGQQHRDTILYGLGLTDDTCFFSFQSMVRKVLKNRRMHEAFILITPELKGDAAAALGMLQAEVGSGLCILYGREETA